MLKVLCSVALFCLTAILLVGCGSEEPKSTEKLSESQEVKTKIKGGHLVKDELPTLPKELRK